MAYATVDERTLYIQGGENVFTNFNQLYSLDLTTNWNTSSPPWKALSMRLAPKDFEDGMVVSDDNNALIVWGYHTGISTYNITSDSWSIVTKTQPASIHPTVGKRIVADPRTGIIYKLASKSSLKKDPQIFVAYNPATNTTQLLTLPPVLAATQIDYHSLVWSTQRNSILLYGGYFDPTNQFNTEFYEYVPDNNNWGVIASIGDIPPLRSGHCMIPAYNGTKMVLFGGQDLVGQAFSSIYIYDITTLTWTRGNDINSTMNRNNMACSVAGDNFVAWGGNQAGDYPAILSTPAIYNLKESQWVSQYNVSFPTTISAPGTITGTVTGTAPVTNTAITSPMDFSSGNRSLTAPIVGGTISGVFVLSIIGYFIHRRSKLVKGYHEGTTTTELESRQVHTDTRPSSSETPLGTSPIEGASLSVQPPLVEQPSLYQTSPYQASTYQLSSYQSSPGESSGTNSMDPQPLHEQHHIPVASLSPYITHTESPQSSPGHHYKTDSPLLVQSTPVPSAPQMPWNSQAMQEPMGAQLDSGYDNDKPLPVEMTPVPSAPEMPQSLELTQEPMEIQLNPDNNHTPLEQQVALIRLQCDLQFQRQQQYLEQLRIEQQAHLELLQKQIADSKRDASTD
ncbi:hypothetical protein BGZ80_003806 [Entomortierella chlamydospora]|uniref:Galactose oxidase n=1 Tax=Entomortierella chlamydospora TaxID=101097 RepID=A0A9P6MNJ8_9FUNG|nr:hypothetical protein BGZ80_003806 [Entomortierella chlamydospora]